MEKLDLKRARRALFHGRRDRFAIVDVPPVMYLMVDGRGDPSTASAYVAAVESLYTTAYALKFASKAAGRDFVVAPLEGLWSAEDPADFVARLHDELMPAEGLTFAGRHHEVYLSDPRRTPADRLKTLLRQPVRPMRPVRPVHP